MIVILIFNSSPNFKTDYVNRKVYNISFFNCLLQLYQFHDNLKEYGNWILKNRPNLPLLKQSLCLKGWYCHGFQNK